MFPKSISVYNNYCAGSRCLDGINYTQCNVLTESFRTIIPPLLTFTSRDPTPYCFLGVDCACQACGSGRLQCKECHPEMICPNFCRDLSKLSPIN